MVRCECQERATSPFRNLSFSEQLCPASAGHFYVDWDRERPALRTSSPSAFDETRADRVGDNSEDHELRGTGS
jgi:hypothetical protein